MKTLRILLIHSAGDLADRILACLPRDKFRVEFEQVGNIPELDAALASKKWDAILSELSVGNGNRFEALEHLRKTDNYTPFILIADDIGDETAASLVRRGVNDRLGSGELGRLGRVITRETRETSNRQQRIETEAAISENETRLQLALEAGEMGVWEWDTTTDSILWSPECSRILGISVAGTSRSALFQMVVEEDRPTVVESFSGSESQSSPFFVKFRLKKNDGEIVWLAVKGQSIRVEPGENGKVIGTLCDVSREKRSEEALIEAEERYRIVAETASDAIISIDRSSTILFANQAAETIFGHTRSELIGQPLSLLMPDHVKRMHTAGLAAYLESGNRTIDWQNLETTALRKDGTEISIQISFGEFKKGDKHSFTAILRDITERKRSSDAVLNSERHFRALAEATTQYVWNLDENGYSTETPTWWTELTGQLQASSQDYGWAEVLHPDDRDRVVNEYTTALRDRVPIETNVRILDVNGEYHWYLARAIPVASDGGRPAGWVCALIEKTAQHQAEEKLRESENRYRMISSVSADYMYATGINTEGEIGLDWVTGAFEKITGYTPEEFVELGGWRSIIHPDDRERDRADFLALLANEPVVSEVRIINRSGDTVWIRSYARPVVDAATGRVTGICGAVQDITDRKLAEQALVESEDRLRAIFNAEPEGVMLLGRTSVVQDINPAGLKMVQAASEDDVIGRPLAELVVVGDRSSFTEFVQDVFDGHNAMLSFGIIGLKGSRQLLEIHAVPMRNTSGEITAILAVTRDITERKRTEKFLIDSQRQYADLINTIEGIVWEADAATFQFTFVSEQAETLLGYPRSDWYQKDFWPKHIHPDDRAFAVQYCTGATAENRKHTFEYRMIAKDGRVIWFRDIVSVIQEKGKPGVIRGIMVDISERKKGEDLLTQRSLLIEQAFDAIFVWDFEKGIIDWNNGCVRMYGYGREEVLGKIANQVLHSTFPLSHDEFLEELKKARYWSGEVSQVTRDGRTVYADCRCQLIEHDGRTIVLQTNRDVTDRRLAELRLRESEARYRDLFESNPYPMFVFELDSLKFLAVNDAAVFKYGYSREEFASMDITDIRPPEDADAVVARARGDNPVIYNAGLWRHRKKDGTLVDVEITSHALDFLGKKARLVLAHDVTDRLRAEEELRRQRERLEKTAEAAPSAIRSFRMGADGSQSFLYSSPAVKEMFGMTPDELRDKAGDFFARMHPDDEVVVRRKMAQSAATLSMYHAEFRYLHPEKGERWIETYASPTREPDGSTVWHGIANDITEQRASEEALRSSEEQLRQAQKLESIGILAGGMAHDFNNMLTAINGYSELILRKIKADDPIRQNVEEIRKAGERSAELTRQLLAFSRRQILQPKQLNLNEVVGETATMLQRLIGEDIVIKTKLREDLVMVEADPGQIAQVLMNLVVNARDAINGSGTITIETDNIFLDATYAKHHVDVRPGDYVMLSVADNGTGMDEATRARIFEPFFTTKSVGRGTGLGLSTVYGIVKQSGGNIWVYSERGHGSTFKIFLPQAGIPAREPDGNISQRNLHLGSETILLVEDEETVRGLGREILESCGYSVIEAGNGVDALEKIRTKNANVDLMITDIVMPEMGGRELAERMASQHPNLKVLYTSGYTDDAVVRHGIVGESTNFLQKPFTFNALSRKVRTLLDEE